MKTRSSFPVHCGRRTSLTAWRGSRWFGAWRILILPGIALGPPGPVHASSLVTQTFAKAGWNALWLEVEPTNPAIDEVFGGLPIESAWTFRTRESALDFIQDASEPVWNRDRWLS